MKFSIVVPSYNQAEFLPVCLDSLFQQANVELEVLVYDGGSTDGSKKIIEKYSDKIGYWQCQPDGGQAAAIKAGFERASGDILGWLNSDDILFPDTLQYIARHFQDDPDKVMIYGDAVWIDGNKNVIKPKREIDFDWSIFAYGYCYVPQPSAFFRREAYKRTGGVDSSFKCCMDYDLYHRLVFQGEIGHVPVFVSGLRDHAKTKTNTLKDLFGIEHDILRQKYLHCSKLMYQTRHLYERGRRILLKASQGRYKTMTLEEIESCGLKRETMNL